MPGVSPVSVNDVAVAEAGTVTETPVIADAGAVAPSARRIVTPAKSASVGLTQASLIEVSPASATAVRVVTGPGGTRCGGVPVVVPVTLTPAA